VGKIVNEGLDKETVFDADLLILVHRDIEFLVLKQVAGILTLADVDDINRWLIDKPEKQN
jgi:hypothetical protein